MAALSEHADAHPRNAPSAGAAGAAGAGGVTYEIMRDTTESMLFFAWPSATKSMPGSSALGDNRHQPRPQPAAEVQISVEDASSPPAPTIWNRVATGVVCVMLLGSGIAVGIWAAVNEAAMAAR